MNKRAGFTLVEILIVIAVVGVLATGVILVGRKITQVVGMRSIATHIQNVVAAHSGFIGQRGAIASSVGVLNNAPVLSGAAFSTSTATVVAPYVDMRMVYVANELMRIDDVMFNVPLALRGGIGGNRAYPAYELVASQISSLDARTWTRSPDQAMTGPTYPTLANFLLDGQSVMVCYYNLTATLRPAPDGSARTGPALTFSMFVGASTYEMLVDELEEKLGRTKGYYVTVIPVTTSIYSVNVTSPRLAL